MVCYAEQLLLCSILGIWKCDFYRISGYCLQFIKNNNVFILHTLLFICGSFYSLVCKSPPIFGLVTPAIRSEITPYLEIYSISCFLCYVVIFYHCQFHLLLHVYVV